jgi:hypothetical protein
MRAALLIAALLAAPPAVAEIVDRIAVTVGDRIITDSDVRQMLRISAFLNAEPPNFSSAERRKAADRLVDQTFLRREMELSRFPAPADSEATPMLDAVRAGRFPTESAFRQALAQAGVTKAELRQRLLWQARLLRFIEFRFNPGIQLSRAELETYYNREYLPRWKATTNLPPPTLEETRAEIERDVNARKADEALEEWLRSARTRLATHYHPEAFE